jgi:hypothetical protein
MTGDGSDTTLTLSIAPASENSTFVTIDGVVQHKDTYSVSGTTLTFSAAPPNGSAVECISFANTTVTTTKLIQDADEDTKIQVEESSDEDKIRFDTGGTERMVIDDSGNVSVGTTATGAGGLNLAEDINLTFSSDTTNSYANLFRQKSSAATVLAQGYKYSNTNNGFTSSIGSSWAKTAISQNYGTIRFYTDAAATTAVGTDVTPTERMRITDAGNVGIGTSSPANKFQVSGGNYSGYVTYLANSGTGGGNHGMYIDNGSTSSYLGIWRSNSVTRFYVDGSGNYYFSGSNQSDRNKKENITDLTDNALDLVTQLQPKKYNYIGSDIDKAGFIAQDMETVIPRLVSGNTFDPDASDDIATNPTGKGIDYMGYTAYLTKAIQELKTELDAAKARIETLENA